jgi:hypothetical protein
MEYGAIDLHKKESQIRIVTKSGEVIDQRIATTRERLTHVFWGRPPMRVLVEASTESEWVAQHLEHQWLFLHPLESVATIRRLVASTSTNTTTCFHIRRFEDRPPTRWSSAPGKQCRRT